MGFDMKIEFGKVELGRLARENIQKCLDSNWVTAGPMVEEFERQYAKTMGYQYVRAVNSGTSADFVACLCLYSLCDAQPGDEIIVPALGFIAAHSSIIAAGFVPVPCDIKIETLNIDESKIEALITPRTKAIMVINTMGKPCKIDVIKDICHRHHLRLIIDNCEGHGCKFQGQSMAEIGADAVTYSFYAAHIVFANQMGAVCSHREIVADLVDSIRSHGRPIGDKTFQHDRFGWNCQPNDLCAAIGLESIGDFKHVFNNRRWRLKQIVSRLEHLPFYMNVEDQGDTNSPHAVTITFKNDDEHRFQQFYKYLHDKGIDCKLNFKSAFTQQKALKQFHNYKPGDFPAAEYVGRNGLHLPCHQHMNAFDIQYIVDTIKAFT
jgi:perosamine synthetase